LPLALAPANLVNPNLVGRPLDPDSAHGAESSTMIGGSRLGA
jgi:hypothetical protein